MLSFSHPEMQCSMRLWTAWVISDLKQPMMHATRSCVLLAQLQPTDSKLTYISHPEQTMETPTGNTPFEKAQIGRVKAPLTWATHVAVKELVKQID